MAGQDQPQQRGAGTASADNEERGLLDHDQSTSAGVQACNEPLTFTFADDGAIPNSRLPMLVYRAAVPADPAAIETTVRREPLASGVARQRASVPAFPQQRARGFGRRARPGQGAIRWPRRRNVGHAAGDVVVLPAGVGHCRLEKSADLLIVGAYPDNASAAGPASRRPGRARCVVRNIAAVATPNADPVAGGQGALVSLWGG